MGIKYALWMHDSAPVHGVSSTMALWTALIIKTSAIRCALQTSTQ